MKRDSQSVSRDLIGVGELVEVRVLNDEWAGRRFFRKFSGGVQRMNNCYAGQTFGVLA
jgi:hypothetical protein